jgi:predicted metal-dependent hydrolase
MTSPDRYLNALAAIDLPAEWRVEVAIRPRRRCAALEVKPGGEVGILVPPGTDPDELARFVGSRRRWLAAQVDTATRLAPDHAVKQLVDREEFTLLGRRYRLCLVNTTPAAVEQLSAATTDGLLYVRRQRPQQIRRAIIEVYRQAGLAWLRREGRQYELASGIARVNYVVRDLGRQRWGTYAGPPQHATTLHWAVFGLPVHLAEYVLVHEQAHAARPAGQPHGCAWQRQVTLWMPDWRERKAELAEVGRHAWLGDWSPSSPGVLPPSG